MTAAYHHGPAILQEPGVPFALIEYRRRQRGQRRPGRRVWCQRDPRPATLPSGQRQHQRCGQAQARVRQCAALRVQLQQSTRQRVAIEQAGHGLAFRQPTLGVQAGQQTQRGIRIALRRLQPGQGASGDQMGVGGVAECQCHAFAVIERQRLRKTMQGLVLHRRRGLPERQGACEVYTDRGHVGGLPSQPMCLGRCIRRDLCRGEQSQQTHRQGWGQIGRVWQCGIHASFKLRWLAGIEKSPRDPTNPASQDLCPTRHNECAGRHHPTRSGCPDGWHSNAAVRRGTGS